MNASLRLFKSTEIRVALSSASFLLISPLSSLAPLTKVC